VDAKAVPGPQERRFAAYIEGLAKAAGHADRKVPLKNYCTGLLLPGERKSVEPMAARLAPNNVRRMHQSLHHLVADAPWNDEAVLDAALDFVLPAMLACGPVVAWVVDDTGFPKKGQHSVGVARQYCGEIGKQDNCRVAVSLSVTTETSSMPVAFGLYLPEVWANDSQRREKAGVPAEVLFRTKPEIALEQIRLARARGIPEGVVLADAGYGTDTGFRTELTKLELRYVAGIQSAVTVWKPGEGPKPAPNYHGTGRPPRLLQRDAKHHPVSVKDLALSLPTAAWKSRDMATRSETETAVPVCRASSSPGTSRLLAGRAARGRVVADRMAPRRRATHQILALDSTCRDLLERVGANGQASLDHGARLRGTEAGVGTGPLRGTGLARIPSPRHPLSCGLWVPGGRAEPFFPLGARRESRTTSARPSDGLPAARLAFAPSGITHNRSPPCASP